MQLIQDPKTPWWIRMASLILATCVALAIAYLVFTFAYYASGMAALDQQKQQPIPLQFSNP